MKYKKQNPPKVAEWLLECLVDKGLSYPAMGDFEEQFHLMTEEKGLFFARLIYRLQILAVLPAFIKNLIYWSVTMISNYLKITYRNLFRHKGYSTINILGLAIGIACTILMLQWVQDEMSYDRFHKNADNLYAATFSNGSKVTPTALAEFLKAEYPEVANTSRFGSLGRQLMKYGENQTMESGGIMVDPAFLEMFTVNFLHGDPNTALKDPYSFIISKTLAEKIFGTEEAVGNNITFANALNITVTGVFEDYPLNSHIQFEYIIPVSLSNVWWGNNLNTWEYNNIRTYVQLQNGISSQSVDPKISDVVEKHRHQDKRPLSLQPVTRLHLYNFRGDGGPIIYVYTFSVMAFFILLIACINFMNLSTARSAVRAKEVGMRKTVGAHKSDLIKQFFSESLLFTIIALITGIVFVVMFLPVFNDLTGKHFTIGFLSELQAVFGIIGITLLTGIIAGSYPAFYLSHFQPVKVLKGIVRSGAKSHMFRKVLVVVQFSLSILLIIGTLIIFIQINYLKNRELGLDKDNIVYTRAGGRFVQNIETIKSEMLQNPNILNVTLTNVAPFRWMTNAGVGDVHWEGKVNQEVKMVVTSVDYDYLETFKLEIVRGRFFSKNYPTDISDAFVINEAAAEAMQMDSPIGKELRIWDIRGKIIGVLKNYNFESLHNEIIPMAMRIIPNWYGQVCIRINPDNISAALGFLEKKFKDIYPEYPFEYYFLDDTIRMRYSSEEEIGRICKYFTFLAIFISCLGLFGLASFTAEQRTKEIGIRKVLGASISHIIRLLSKEFLILVTIANIIAWPFAYLIMNKMLQEYAYKIDLSIWIFVSSGFLSLVIALATVSYQSIKAAAANPVDSLRSE